MSSEVSTSGPGHDREPTVEELKRELAEARQREAVTAIEITRLFEAEHARSRGLKEALEFQTATSEVLAVISRSQADIHRVFSTILESAVRLCKADLGGISRVEDGQIVPVAVHPNKTEFWEVANQNFSRPVDTSSNLGRAIVEGRTISRRFRRRSFRRGRRLESPWLPLPIVGSSFPRRSAAWRRSAYAMATGTIFAR
jgi:hypothetical protein